MGEYFAMIDAESKMQYFPAFAFDRYYAILWNCGTLTVGDN